MLINILKQAVIQDHEIFFYWRVEAIDVLRTIMEGSIKYEIKAEGLADFYMEKRKEISLPDLVDGEGNVIGKGTLNKNGKVEGMRVLYLPKENRKNVILKWKKMVTALPILKMGK